MADVNISLGVKPDLGELNRELNRVRRIVEDKLKGLRLDIRDANVSTRTRPGRIQRSLRPELLSASSRERNKAQESAISAVTQRLAVLQRQLDKTTSGIASLTERRDRLTAAQQRGEAGAKDLGISLNNINRQINGFNANINRSAERQNRLSDEITRTRGALSELTGLFDRVNTALAQNVSTQTRETQASNNVAQSAIRAVRGLEQMGRAAAVAADFQRRATASIGGVQRGSFGRQLPPDARPFRGRPEEDQGPAQTALRVETERTARTFGLVRLTADQAATALAESVVSLERNEQGNFAITRSLTTANNALVTFSANLTRSTQTLTNSVRRIDTVSNNLVRSTGGGAGGAGGGGGSGAPPGLPPGPDPFERFRRVPAAQGAPPPRAFRQGETDDQIARERREAAREARRILLNGAREFARAEFEAGRTIRGITNDLRAIGPVAGTFRDIIQSEGVRAAKQFSADLVQFRGAAGPFAASLREVPVIVRGAAEELRIRFGLTGTELQNATDDLATKLRAAVNKRIEGDLKFAQSTATQRVQQARQQARLLAAQEAQTRSVDTGRTRASQETLARASAQLAREFQIGGAGLAKALEAFAAEFEKQRVRTFRNAEKDAVRIQRGNERYAAAIEKTAEAERQRAQNIRTAASQAGLTGQPLAITQGVAGGIAGGRPAGAFNNLAQQLNQLSPQQQAGTIRALTATGQSARNAGVQFSTFSAAIQRANPLVRQYAAQLNIGSRAAFEFGVQAREAATRLAAWAAPSVFVFQAIGALRTALDTIVELDTQLRRLAFFSADNNPFDNLAARAAGFTTTASQLTGSFQAIIREAERTGLSLTDVTEAIVTLSRVGETPLRFNEQLGGLEATPILEAVQGLVRLEGGALSAARATEILKAILEQNNLTTQDSISVASSLAVQSRKTSFDIERLGVVVTGVGSAFRNLQNLTFDETLAIASVAARRLGTNASRTRTALRQLSTLFVRFSKEIEEATGVQVADDQGRLRNISALFEALEQVNRLRGTTGGFALADLFAEAENIPDLQNLAAGAQQFKNALNEVGSGTGNLGNALAFTRQSVDEFFKQSENQAQSFRSTFNRLTTSVVQFAEAIRLDEAFAGFARGASGVLGVIADLVNAIGRVPGLLQAIVAVSLAPLIRGITQAAAGFFLASRGAGAVAQAQSQLVQASQQAATGGLSGISQRTNVIAEAQREGFITQQRATELTRQNNVFLQRRLQLEALKNRFLAEANALEAQNGAATVRSVELKTLAITQQQRLDALKADELALNRQITAELAKQSSAQAAAARGLVGKIGTAALFAGAFVGNAVASGVRDSSPVLSSVISGAVNGAVLGATVGSVFGVPGAAIAGTAGAVIGGVVGGVSGSRDQEKQRQQNQRRQAEIIKAQASRRRQIVAQADAELRSSAELSSTEARLVQLKRDAALAQSRLVELQQTGRQTAQAELAVRKANNALLNAQVQLQREAKDRVQDRIRLERELTDIRQRRARVDLALVTLREREEFVAERAGRSGVEIRTIRFEFDRRQISAQAASIRQELTRTQQAIASLRGRRGRGQEQRSLEQRARRLENQLQNIRFKALQQEFQARRDILKIATEEQTKQIDAWKNAAREVTSAFGNILQDQRNIARLISTQTQIDVNLDVAQQELRNLIPNIVGDVTAQLDIARRGLAATQRQGQIGLGQFDRQRDRLLSGFGGLGEQGTPVEFTELNAAAQQLRAAFAGAVRDIELNAEQRRLRAQAQINADLLRQRAQLNRQLIQIEQNRARAQERAIRAEITARQQLIRSSQQLIEAQSRRGAQLLEDPAAFGRQLQQIRQVRGLFGGQDLRGQQGFSQIQRIVDRFANQPGGLAALREIQAGLQAAVQQGVRVNQGLSAEQLLQRFQAAIIGGADVQDAARTQDENIAQLKVANQNLQNNLTEQKKLVAQQIKLESALGLLNRETASFSVRNLAAQEKLAKTFTDKLEGLQASFDAVSSKLDGLNTIMNTLLKGSEFKDSNRLIVSTIQQLQQALTIDRGGIRLGEQRRASDRNRQNQLFSLFQRFGGGRGAEGIRDAAGFSARQLQDFFRRFEGLTAQQVQALSEFVGPLSGTTEEATRALQQLRQQFGPATATAITNALRGTQGGIADLRGGAIREALQSTVDRIRTSSRTDLTNASISSALQFALGRSGLDRNTQIEAIGRTRNLIPLIRQLQAAQRTALAKPTDEAAQKRAKDLDARIVKLIETISTQISTGEILTDLNAALKAINETRREELRRRDAAAGPGAVAGTSLGRALEEATVLQGAAASEERREFIRAITSAGTGQAATKFDEAVRRLEKALSDGVKVTANPVNIQFNSNVRTELAANAQLRDTLNRLTGGNQDEANRVLRLLGELIRLENQRGTRLSADAQAAAGGGGAGAGG